MTGCIFSIQKFCLHDGPGIRTTLFFKGCNLRCRWCANPESQRMDVQLTLDREKCRGCGACVSACPRGVRRLEGGLLQLNEAACSLCGRCMEVCPAQAVAREGREAELEEVLRELLKDKAFYEHSGGGVTFSGGEALLQREFAAALTRALHAQGVHVAVETAACVPTEAFMDFIREVDLVLIDLKHYDSRRHREGTGAGNAPVLANLRALKASGRDFELRIPVIPGYNDGIGDAQAFAALLASMGIDTVRLLPFHQLGERKYSLLGMDYAYAGRAQLHSEDLEAYTAAFERGGVHVQL